MNVSGHWQGKYKYGKGYPLSVIGKMEPFDLFLVDNNGIITGYCDDLIVKSIEANESTIDGVFKDEHIHFLKKYKYNSFIEDESIDPADLVPIEDLKSEGIHYRGKLYKKIFSRKPYFSGEWKITSTYTDKTNATHEFTVGGSWTMNKID